MDLRQTPLIDSLVSRFSAKHSFPEAMAKVVAEVSLDEDNVLDPDKQMVAVRLQSNLLARWSAEVSVMTAAKPHRWDLASLQEAYRTINDATSFLSYVATWMQMQEDDDE